MSTNDYILNLLIIKDKNINILSNNIISKNINGKNTKIIQSILTYKPDFCPICGSVNDSSNDIIKWGFKKIVKLKFLKFLIVIVYLSFINKDFFVNTVIILLSFLLL